MNSNKYSIIQNLPALNFQHSACPSTLLEGTDFARQKVFGAKNSITYYITLHLMMFLPFPFLIHAFFWLAVLLLALRSYGVGGRVSKEKLRLDSTVRQCYHRQRARLAIVSDFSRIMQSGTQVFFQLDLSCSS